MNSEQILGAPAEGCTTNCCVRAGGNNRTRTHWEEAFVGKFRLAAMLHLRVVGMFESWEPAARCDAFSHGTRGPHNKANFWFEAAGGGIC
jgi:hypothetical protein